LRLSEAKSDGKEAFDPFGLNASESIAESNKSRQRIELKKL
jgi:hypothetical protein